MCCVSAVNPQGTGDADDGLPSALTSHGLYSYGLLVMACIVMAYIVIAYIVMAYIVITTTSCRAS